MLSLDLCDAMLKKGTNDTCVIRVLGSLKVFKIYLDTYAHKLCLRWTFWQTGYGISVRETSKHR